VNCAAAALFVIDRESQPQVIERLSGALWHKNETVALNAAAHLHDIARKTDSAGTRLKIVQAYIRRLKQVRKSKEHLPEKAIATHLGGLGAAAQPAAKLLQEAVWCSWPYAAEAKHALKLINPDGQVSDKPALDTFTIGGDAVDDISLDE
jgi:hypothetical protein